MVYSKTEWTNYNPQIPNSGTKISAAKMNKIEDGIFKNNEEILKVKGVLEEEIICKMNPKDYYTTNEINVLLNSLKRLSDGIEFVINSWTQYNDIYTSTINHNLNISIKNIEIKFYTLDNEFVNLDYKITNNNSIKVYSDSTSEIIAIIKKPIEEYLKTNIELPEGIINKINQIKTRKIIYVKKSAWTKDESTQLYFTSITHDFINQNNTDIDVKFYFNNSQVFFDYTVLSNNSINIKSDAQYDITVTVDGIESLLSAKETFKKGDDIANDQKRTDL